jgi:hypothetical protein
MQRGNNNEASQIIQNSLLDTRIEKVLEKIGYDGTIPQEIRGRLLKDLSEEQARGLIISFQEKMKAHYAKESLEIFEKTIPKDLEAIVNPQESGEASQ